MKVSIKIVLAAVAVTPLFADFIVFGEDSSNGHSIVSRQEILSWNTKTNGVQLGASVEGRVPYVVALNVSLEALPELEAPNTNRSRRIRGTYFKATNSFVGPMKLLGPNGTLVTSKRPELTETNAYPPNLQLSQVRTDFLSRYSNYSGPGLAPITIESGPLPPIKLADVYDLHEAGVYQLMVWPAIYRRSAPNSDSCELVQTLPTTVTFTNRAN